MKVKESTIIKSVDAVKEFASEKLAPLFVKDVGTDEDELKACVISALMTACDAIMHGKMKFETEEPEEETEKEPEEEPKPSKKRQKKGKNEDEEAFLKRVCCEVGEEFLGAFQEFDLTRGQVRNCMLMCVNGFIDVFDLEGAVFAKLMSKLAK